jgi:ABC-type transport system involved in cytochrome c biogenesis permease subunit
MSSLHSGYFFNACAFFYVSALFMHIAFLVKDRVSLRRIAITTTALGLIAQSLGLATRWMEAGEVEVAAFERATALKLSGLNHLLVFVQHPPWSNLYEILVYMAYGIVVVSLVCEVKWKIRFISILALLLALLIFGLASLSDDTIRPLVPALKSWWIMIHVISASIAYAAGALAAFICLFYLFKAELKVSLSSLASGALFLTGVLYLLLGRGLTLWSTFEYKVKLVRSMADQDILVGSMVNEQFTPFFVASPGVGPILMLATVLCFGMGLWFRIGVKKMALGRVELGLYWFCFIVSLALSVKIVANGVLIDNLELSPELGARLMPPPPWRLTLRSNVWDLGILAIALSSLLVVGIVISFPKSVRRLLPPLSVLDNAAHNCVLVAFALMAVVLTTGALWAHYAWGRYWAWDPKETGALIIWLTYALYLHSRMTKNLAGVGSAVIGICGFFVILAGFLGVNLGFFANGLHSYGST